MTAKILMEFNPSQEILYFLGTSRFCKKKTKQTNEGSKEQGE